MQRKRKSTAGVTLLEVMIAMIILAIALVGTLSLLITIQSHNQSADDTRTGYKACQEILEQLLAMDYNTMLGQDGVPFVATDLHPTAQIGTIAVDDISPPGDPNSLAEITVGIVSLGETLRPMDIRIVSWRANK